MLLSTPVEKLPTHHDADIGEVFRNHGSVVARRQVNEPGTYIGYVLGLFNAPVQCRLFYNQSCLLQLRPAFESDLSRGGHVGFKCRKLWYPRDFKRSIYRSTQQSVQLLLLGG